MSRSIRTICLPLAAADALLGAACGGPSDEGITFAGENASEEAPATEEGHTSGKAHSGAPSTGEARTIEIEMKDDGGFAYEPDTLSVKAGDSLRLVFRNVGAIVHDALIGDARAQEKHESAGHGHQTGHGDTSAPQVTVQPGQSQELTHTFPEAGEFIIGCHQP
ncbi:MAG: cupredoxin domain-containing protein, partial [Acidimicrobiia bacterium]